MPTAISIAKLTKAFGSGPTTATAVDQISLDIEPGELFFLLGPSGCGKTTLLRMIAGFIEPTSGSICFDGREVAGLPPNKRNTGMVFQSYALWPHMTVEQNVAFGLDLRKVSAPEKSRRIQEALAAVHMESYAKRKPNQLSGGQQQRIALARALVIRPDVLLLDEPLSNLDAKLRIELRSEIRRICKEGAPGGITTVYVTHDQKEALSMADRVAILDRGHVVQIGPPRDLYRRPATRFVAEFLGETNFLPARVVSQHGSETIVRTAAGDLRASSTSALGPDLLCSIRPEAIRLATSPTAEINSLSGMLVDTTFLGELAQYTVLLPGNLRIKVADLNPGARIPSRNERVTVVIAPEDVVVLPVT